MSELMPPHNSVDLTRDMLITILEYFSQLIYLAASVSEWWSKVGLPLHPGLHEHIERLGHDEYMILRAERSEVLVLGDIPKLTYDITSRPHKLENYYLGLKFSALYVYSISTRKYASARLIMLKLVL